MGVLREREVGREYVPMINLNIGRERERERSGGSLFLLAEAQFRVLREWFLSFGKKESDSNASYNLISRTDCYILERSCLILS